MNFSSKIVRLLLCSWVCSVSLLLCADAYTLKYDNTFRQWGTYYFPFEDWKHWKAQGLAESGLNPKATSYCGARGIMQLMPYNGIYDDEGNIQHGIALDKAFSKYWAKIPDKEDWRNLTYASYNAGPGNILKAQKLSGGALTWLVISSKLSSITGAANVKQTQDYIAHISKFYKQLQ